MDIVDAQRDLRRAYVGGGPGAIVSGSVWVVAGFMASLSGKSSAFTLLFFGGMLIFPLATLICRAGFRRAKESVDNPMGWVALESTIAMIGGFVGAWLMLRFEPAFVFPLAALAVGTHYAVFKTAYGDRLYWVLAAAISCVGVFDILNFIHTPGGPIFAVGLIEIVFGVVLMLRSLGEEKPS